MSDLNSDFNEFLKETAKREEDENGGQQSTMGGEYDLTAGLATDVDIVFCIDVTESMRPVLDTVKGMAMSLYDDLVKKLGERRRKIRNLRVKVIPFRDYYCDGEFAMAESEFFNLPDETAAFHSYVLNLTADGGGDEPENALEAIALAMKSDWVKAASDNERARNVIVVFTDASAHPFEKAQDGVTKFYPTDMLTSLDDFTKAWVGQNSLGGDFLIDQYRMDPFAKRMIIYSPQDSYPWSDFQNSGNIKMSSIEPAKGGKELDRDILLEDISGSIRG